jgi:molybdate transport system substrate-binding protein
MNTTTSLLLAIALAVAPSVRAEAISVFAAASLTESFKELGKMFGSQGSAQFNFGATNELRTQIEHGARADVFASASQEEMDKAVKAGIVKDPVVFVRNRLVLIVPKANPGGIKSLKDLARPGLKLVTTHPNVPVGKYTMQMLEKMAQDPKYGASYAADVKKNFRSLEVNVKAVAAKVSLSEADAGVVYYSDVTARLGETVQAFDIPAKFNVDATYPIAVVAKAAHAETAQKFIEFVTSPAAQEVFKKYNFRTVK